MALQMLWVFLLRLVLMPKVVLWLSPWGREALIPVSFFFVFKTSQLWSLGVPVYVAWEYRVGQRLGEGEEGVGGNIFQFFL